MLEHRRATKNEAGGLGSPFEGLVKPGDTMLVASMRIRGKTLSAAVSYQWFQAVVRSVALRGQDASRFSYAASW